MRDFGLELCSGAKISNGRMDDFGKLGSLIYRQRVRYQPQGASH
jgi:hypothetical protein